MKLNNKNHITLKDLAKKLRMSPSTISRALGGHPDISPVTKEKVLTLATELNYSPNSIAQSLRIKSTKTIGIIVPEIKHNFFSSVISGIEDVAYANGYSIMVCQSNEDFEREVVNARALVSNRVAGILISVSQTTTNSDHFKQIQSDGIPLVFFDRVFDDIGSTTVVVDDFNGAFKAVEHLIQSGYKQIAHLAGPNHLSVSRNRMLGYLEALKHYDITVPNNLIVYGGLNEDDGIAGFQKLMELGNHPEAIFAVNDPVAIGAHGEIRKNGLNIPDDIGLVGFSDDLISSYINPPLTTMAQPAYDMGQAAIINLLGQINNNKGDFETKLVVLKTNLIIRESSKRSLSRDDSVEMHNDYMNKTL